MSARRNTSNGGSGGGPVGPVTLAGDVTGPSSANEVSELQGVTLTVDTSSPQANGQPLMYDGTQFRLGNIGLNAGDLTGQIPFGAGVAVAKFQGYPLDLNTWTPTAGHVMTYDGTEWTGLPASGGGTLAGDVVGPSGSNTVERIQGLDINNNASSDGDMLVYNLGAGYLNWVPGAGSASLAGDVTGLTTATVVGAIQGVPVLPFPPDPGQTFVYNSNTGRLEYSDACFSNTRWAVGAGGSSTGPTASGTFADPCPTPQLAYDAISNLGFPDGSQVLIGPGTLADAVAVNLADFVTFRGQGSQISPGDISGTGLKAISGPAVTITDKSCRFEDLTIWDDGTASSIAMQASGTGAEAIELVNMGFFSSFSIAATISGYGIVRVNNVRTNAELRATNCAVTLWGDVAWNGGPLVNRLVHIDDGASSGTHVFSGSIGGLILEGAPVVIFEPGASCTDVDATNLSGAAGIRFTGACSGSFTITPDPGGNFVLDGCYVGGSFQANAANGAVTVSARNAVLNGSIDVGDNVRLDLTGATYDEGLLTVSALGSVTRGPSGRRYEYTRTASTGSGPVVEALYTTSYDASFTHHAVVNATYPGSGATMWFSFKAAYRIASGVMTMAGTPTVDSGGDPQTWTCAPSTDGTSICVTIEGDTSDNVVFNIVSTIIEQR